MFLQKMSLSKTTSYKISTSEENLLENLELLYNKIPLITVYSSKASSDEEISMESSTKKVFSLTAPQYKKLSSYFDCPFAVISQPKLLKQFGYSLSDISGPIIAIDGIEDDSAVVPDNLMDNNIMGNINSAETSVKSDSDIIAGFEILPLFKFFIPAEKNDRFTIIYMIANLDMINSLAVISKSPERVKMFSKIFQLDISAYSYGDQVTGEDATIFLDGYDNSIISERIFIIGNKSFGAEKLMIDSSDAGKFKYRINDVMRALSPGAVKRSAQFDYSIYKNINK